MDSATQLLEKAVHCLDASAWPFSMAEVLARLASNASGVGRSTLAHVHCMEVH